MTGTKRISTASALRAVGLSEEDSPYRLSDGGGFDFLAPEELLGKVRSADWHDPVLLQVLPRGDEEREHRGFVADPVGDLEAMVVPGLIHKYRSRVLVLATGACAVHCRYCFRRAFPYGSARLTAGQQKAIWEYVRARPGINEVIFSGGDPLVLKTSPLSRLVEGACSIDHVRSIRFHSRVPVVSPARVDRELCGMLKRVANEQTCRVVIHANCAQELGPACARALRRLSSVGAQLLNQSVLLKGINDSADALEELSVRLTELGVVPYYLHQLDRAQGTAHFEVPVAKGRRLMRALRKRLPGYAVPTYVREVPGAEGKVPL
jgi:EF-P beta-lysylation protein EpmB